MIKIPYTLKIILPVIGWGLLCSFFSYTLILTAGNLSDPALRFFLWGTPFCLLVLGLFFFLSCLYGKEAKIINKM